MTTPDRDVVPSGPSTRSRGTEIFSVALAPEVGARHFRYRDAYTANLRRYDVGAAPIAGVHGGLYPFATLGGPVDAGIVGEYAHAIALDSAPTGGDTVSTSWYRFHVGARGRARIGQSFVLGFGVGYGGETFGFGGSAMDTQIPAVAYRYVRPALDARVAFGRFAIEAQVGYDAIVSAGSVADRFPHAKVGGVDASLGPTFAITRQWEIGLAASYRRFFYSMHPEPGDAFVAGGALDEMMGLSGSVAYVF